jgi:signal peptidase
MDLRSLAGAGVTAIFVVLVVAMLVGQQLGQPIVLGFVLTGSMDAEPANMAPGDRFIAVPPAVAGDVGEGDLLRKAIVPIALFALFAGLFGMLLSYVLVPGLF